MNLFRFLLPLTLLVTSIGCTQVQPEPEAPKPPRPKLDKIAEWLKTVPGVSQVKELEDPDDDYKKYFMLTFEQLIDPKNPSVGTFSQRVFLSHQDFDSPMVFDGQGYSAEDALKSPSTCELTDRYKANRLEVEHRYAGESVPFGSDWKYLTLENAAADMHAVRKALGVAYTGKWIATGASKSGTNAMSYAMHYPEDVAATVAYVCPVINGEADPRFLDHLMTVGTPEMRKKIEDFQVQLLLRRDRLQESLAVVDPTPGARETMTEEQEYESYVLTFAQSQWQYALPTDIIPDDDATDKEILDYLRTRFNKKGALSPVYGVTNQSGLSRKNGKPDYDNIHYNVQSLTEEGSPMYVITPRLLPLMPNHKSWTENTLARFLVPASAADLKYSDVWYNKMINWFKNSDPKLICVFGEYDYWTAAAPDRAYFEGKSNMAIYTKKGGAHSTSIIQLSAADQQSVWAKLDSWIKN
ncbi:MAG: S28 family serine protease [Mucinivorans sp.]